MSNEIEYKDLIAFHPGSYVEDIVDDLNITQSEFADRLGTTPKTVSKLINGEERLSNDLANSLSKVTGISVKTWLNLQSAYDAKVIEIDNHKNADEKEICRQIDFKALKDNGFVKNKSQYAIDDKITTLRNLFNVASLASLSKFNPAISYRRTSNPTEKGIVNANVMLEIASNIARNKSSVRYTKKKLQEKLADVRKMTLQNPQEFWPSLKDMLLECGIVLVGLPSFKGAGLHGATKKFKNGSVMLLVTDRMKDADVFWFSLIHEIGHILNEDFSIKSIDYDEYELREQRANMFAADFLIDPHKYDEFVDKGDFSHNAVRTFANDLGILPCIVVGRLRKDSHLTYSDLVEFNIRYTISFDSSEE